jgi:hypothetical protein
MPGTLILAIQADGISLLAPLSSATDKRWKNDRRRSTLMAGVKGEDKEVTRRT